MSLTSLAAIREETRWIVIHHTNTPPDLELTAEQIRRQHRSRGKFDIGWHFVVRRDGTVEEGRAVDTVGHHHADPDVNSKSIAIGVVGGIASKPRARDAVTDEQEASVEALIDRLQASHGPGLRVVVGD